MSKKLQDSDKPPHAIIEVRDDGTALRNDGMELAPADKNPWYVLATVDDEQTEWPPDRELHARNRRIWNGWACAEMEDAERAKLAAQLGLPVADLAPLTEDEQADLRRAFDDRLGKDAKIPHPTDTIDLSETHLSHTVVWERCVSAAPAIFQDATFSDDAVFRDATFSAFAFFQNATFSAFAFFQNATFSAFAFFPNATFSASADFQDATFSDYADFQDATFSASADFQDATFSASADFQDATFKSTTDFRLAWFKKYVPRFHQCTLHQDTYLTTDPDYWPTARADTAEESKSAYTRLRQMMNELQKPDDEHFFHRRELECQVYLEKGVNKWVLQLFGIVSDYGYSITRPAVALLISILFFWPIYGSCIKNNVCTEPGHPIWQGLGISISSTFSFLGFMRSMHPDFLDKAPSWIDLFSGTQSILGVILLFLFGLGLRTRFRMR